MSLLEPSAFKWRADNAAAMQIEQKSLEQKHDQLRETSRKKDQNMAALQHMYTSLKQEQFTGNIAEAADHDAENVLDAMQFGVSKQRTEPAKPSRAGSIGSSGSGARASHAVQGQRGLPGSRVGLTSARMSYSQLENERLLIQYRSRLSRGHPWRPASNSSECASSRQCRLDQPC